MRIVGYVRVSTAEQADSGLGLAAQRAVIESESARRGWEVVAIFEDAGMSGKTMASRNGLDAALSMVLEGSAQALVVAKLDRLSRSLLDFAALMEQSRSQGWALVALDLGVDTTTPSGEMIANVMATFAQFERRLIGQRTKDALAIKRSQGVRLGRPRSVSDEIVDTIVALRSSGTSWGGIADALNDAAVPTGHGATKWHPATARYVHQSRSSGASEVADADDHGGQPD